MNRLIDNLILLLTIFIIIATGVILYIEREQCWYEYISISHERNTAKSCDVVNGQPVCDRVEVLDFIQMCKAR